MQTVSDIKFLKVRWNYLRESEYGDIGPNAVSKGLDKALTELEVKITEHLKNGWVIKGEVAYPKLKLHGGTSGGTYQYLMQTMVKYEQVKGAEADLLKL